MHTKRISSDTAMELGMHLVETHMRNMDLIMVHGNDPVMVEDSINTMERLLGEDDTYKVVFDLTYTVGRYGHDQNVVVAQLCMHYHVHLYHYCLATVPCERLTGFVNNPDYGFATVDTTNDPKVLKTSGLAFQKLVDIRDKYNICGSKKDMDSDVDLAEAITNPYCGGMKAECDKDKPAWHSAWVKRLDEQNLQTAAKKEKTFYKILRRIVDMRNCLLLEYVEGSSHKKSSGKECHTKKTMC
ncbi:hypothetical protein D1007_54315 [Hordeum vulgare]|nr:hypothetical protein D1007_54315 [Hordeum vulgare]